MVLERVGYVEGSKSFNGFDRRHGFSGGIWLLWNDDSIKIEPLNIHKSFIHVELRRHAKGTGSSRLSMLVHELTTENNSGQP